MKKLILILFFSSFVILSCSQEEEEFTLTVDTSTTTTNILNGVSHASCASLKDYAADPTSDLNYDVASEAVYYNGMNIEWTGTKALSIIAISMIFKNENITGGKFECSLGIEEIEALFEGDANFTSVSRTIRPIVGDEESVKIVSADGCLILCGGMTFKDPTKATLVSGTLEVYGAYYDDDTYVSTIAKTPITSFYKPR